MLTEDEVKDQLAGYFGWLDSVTAEPVAGTAAGAAPNGHRRHWGLAAAAALLVVAIAGVAVARSVDHDGNVRSIPGPSDDTAAPDAASTVPPTSASSTAVPSTASPTTAPPTSAAPSTEAPAAQLTVADIAAERYAALAAYDSVSFTVQVDEEYGGGPDTATTSVRYVTLLNDGTVWATGEEPGYFNSYDPATGVGRIQTLMPDGTLGYMELAGLSDNSVPLMTMLGGIDPATGGWRPDEPVTAGSEDGRDVWRVVRDWDGQIDEWTIDRESGLIVRYEVDWAVASDGRRGHRTVVLSDVRPGATLPPEFPGTPADTATVSIQGDPAAFHPLTLAEAAAQFGPSFVAPASFASGARVTFSSFDNPPAEGVEGAFATTELLVQMTAMEGFARTTVGIWKTMLPAGADVPPGFVVVGDALCRSADGAVCDTMPRAADELAEGAWAGVRYHVDGAAVTASRDGIQVTLAAPTAELALELAETLSTI